MHQKKEARGRWGGATAQVQSTYPDDKGRQYQGQPTPIGEGMWGGEKKGKKLFLALRCAFNKVESLAFSLLALEEGLKKIYLHYFYSSLTCRSELQISISEQQERRQEADGFLRASTDIHLMWEQHFDDPR